MKFKLFLLLTIYWLINVFTVGNLATPLPVPEQDLVGDWVLVSEYSEITNNAGKIIKTPKPMELCKIDDKITLKPNGKLNYSRGIVKCESSNIDKDGSWSLASINSKTKKLNFKYTSGSVKDEQMCTWTPVDADYTPTVGGDELFHLTLKQGKVVSEYLRIRFIEGKWKLASRIVDNKPSDICFADNTFNFKLIKTNDIFNWTIIEEDGLTACLNFDDFKKKNLMSFRILIKGFQNYTLTWTNKLGTKIAATVEGVLNTTNDRWESMTITYTLVSISTPATPNQTVIETYTRM